MAEAFLRQYARDLFEVHSAGLEPRAVHPLAVQVMREIDIDISTQTSKGIETFLGKTFFHYLITLCDDADKNCPGIWPGVNTRMHWSLEDPAVFEGTEEQKLAKFREVRNLLERKIIGWVAGKVILDPDRVRISLSATQPRQP